MSTWEAKYAGSCAICPHAIEVGEEMTTLPISGAPVHADCYDPPKAGRKDFEVCPTCWLTHPPGLCDR